MAATSEHRACEMVRAHTTFRLACEMGRPSEAVLFLPEKAQIAAFKIADCPDQLGNDEQTIQALIAVGERPSRLTAWLTEIRIAANHRRAA